MPLAGRRDSDSRSTRQVAQERGDFCPMPLGIGTGIGGHRTRLHTSLQADCALPPHPKPLPRGEGAPWSTRWRSWRAWNGERLAGVLPLPQGEGWGEGEVGGRTAAAHQNASGPPPAKPEILEALDIPVRMFQTALKWWTRVSAFLGDPPGHTHYGQHSGNGVGPLVRCAAFRPCRLE